jgi:serine/threonine-protein kinase
LTLKEWSKLNDSTRSSQTANRDVRIQLNEARHFLSNNRLAEAIATYRGLAQQQVPEAMYEYANLALQNRNNNISCTDAYNMLINAAEKNYAPAKTALGIIYIYADNEEMLQTYNYYDRCEFTKNLSRGSQLLIGAMLQGDTTAARLLDELNSRTQ